jgi:hypothetical protein
LKKQNVKLIEAVETRQRERIALEPITLEMVEGLFVEDLKVLRNEIYARRGRVFKDAKLQKYFIAQAWYQPNPDFKDEQLTETNRKIWRLFAKPSKTRSANSRKSKADKAEI